MFQDEESFINEELCNPRNEIAHGGGGAPSFATLLTRREKAFKLMERLRTVVVNAALNNSYLESK